MNNASTNNWSALNHLQIGKYAEYLVKMAATSYGYDVYSAEIDDKAIDFVIRVNDKKYLDLQVKSVRISNQGTNYVFFRKKYFKPRSNLYTVIVLFPQNQAPELYLISSAEWLKPNELFVSRDYEGKQSEPEWGLNICQKNLPALKKYIFESTVKLLSAE